jgi:hypothetical protein
LQLDTRLPACFGIDNPSVPTAIHRVIMAFRIHDNQLTRPLDRDSREYSPLHS